MKNRFTKHTQFVQILQKWLRKNSSEVKNLLRNFSKEIAIFFQNKKTTKII